MSGLRNILIHKYFNINIDIVWGIINEDLNTVLPAIEQIRQDLE
jgi:uncharacterized protein with HEPN domain